MYFWDNVIVPLLRKQGFGQFLDVCHRAESTADCDQPRRVLDCATVCPAAANVWMTGATPESRPESFQCDLLPLSTTKTFGNNQDQYVSDMKLASSRLWLPSTLDTDSPSTNFCGTLKANHKNLYMLLVSNCNAKSQVKVSCLAQLTRWETSFAHSS